MKRLIYKIIPLLLAPLLFSSCEDIFHDANTLLDEIREGASGGGPDPRRIYLGGDFTYNWNGSEHQGVAAMNGNGDFEPFFNDGKYGLIIGYPSGTYRGVQDIELTDQYIYVAGNFAGYDTDGTYFDNFNYTYNLSPVHQEYQYLQRYGYNGLFDDSFKPFASVAGSSVEVNGVEILSDGSIVAAGDFDDLYGRSDIVRLGPDPDISNPTGWNAIPSFPAVENSSPSFYALETFFDKKQLLAGGYMQTLFGSVSTSGLAAVDISNLGNEPVSAFTSAKVDLSTAEIHDFASTEDALYIAGSEPYIDMYNYSTERGFVLKYNYANGAFTEDQSFANNFQNVINDHYYEYNADNNYENTYFYDVYTIETDDKGRLYIGGNFYENKADSFQYNNFIRLTPEGYLDSSFRCSPSGMINDIAVQKNGKILICGSFYDINTMTGMRNYPGFVRISEYGYIDEEFNYDFFYQNSTSAMTKTFYTIAIEEEPEEEK